MGKKDTLSAAGVVLLLAAVTHFVRSILDWEVVFNGYVVPLWVSYIIVVVAGVLGVQALRWSQKTF